MKIKVFDPGYTFGDPEKMSAGGSVYPKRMFAGGAGGFELPDNLKKLIANSPEKLDAIMDSPGELDAIMGSPVDVQPIQATTNPQGLSPAQIRAIEQGNLQTQDLGIVPGSIGPGTIEIPEFPGSGQNVPINIPTQPTAPPETTETAPAPITDTGPSLEELISLGLLTAEQIQELINSETLTKENVMGMLNGGFEFSEEQYAQLFEQGLLTRDEIASLVDQLISENETEAGLTEEEVAEIAATSGLSEEQINELIATQMGEQGQFVTQDALTNYATQEELAGLEGLFQNYLTPEQLQGYLPDEGQYLTQDDLQNSLDTADFNKTIEDLTTRLGELETQYADVTSQYEADAVNQQISDTKDELSGFFSSVSPSGPRTGSTSQFKSGSSFLPGGSPMANLIQGQREGQGQDPFSTYLKTFTPSYSSYNAPQSASEWGQNSPLLNTQYSNPFTGGSSYSAAQGGEVPNGIMDLTNFNTNVAPFQNAFRPNKPRT
tara:strand:+ start:3207 stop:4679 length:1473 start_codon:yes stop_codon:yes gene_type:complete